MAIATRDRDMRTAGGALRASSPSMEGRYELGFEFCHARIVSSSRRSAIV